MNRQDEDVKIFKSGRQVQDAESAQATEDLKKLVISGKMQRARDLGKDIALSFRRSADKKELAGIAAGSGVDPDDRFVKDQAILLSVFAAEFCLNNKLGSQSLAAAAVSELYDWLLDDSPELYNTRLGSAAFTFYYMCADDGVDTHHIGETFAMLCGSPDDVKLAGYGVQVYENAVKTYEDFIDRSGLR